MCLDWLSGGSNTYDDEGELWLCRDFGVFFFFKQKTAYEIYQCDWSSDVCSSDLILRSGLSLPCPSLQLEESGDSR